MSATFVPSKLVLCVEDNQTEQRLLKEILTINGFEVLQARTATKGLQLFRHNPVVLVIIDQQLGRKQVTGAQLAGKIKGVNPKVPVVLRSGYPPPTMRQTWDAFINKGETIERFLALVEDLIRRSAA